MAKLEIIIRDYPHLTLYMYPEDHYPPHFHVRSGDANVAVLYLENPDESVWSKKLNRRVKKALLEVASQNKERLLQEFETLIKAGKWKSRR